MIAMAFRFFVCLFLSVSTLPASPKIALLFLTQGDLNHSAIWEKFLRKTSDKYTVYIHAKHPLKAPFFKKYRIQKTVPTSWSIHVKAWQALIQEAVKEPENIYFAFLSESCIPLYSLNAIYDTIVKDPRTHMAFARPWWPPHSPREVYAIDPIFRHGNSEWMVLNRKHAELVAKDRSVIRIISKYENDQESYFATLLAMHDAFGDDICNHSYTYVDWGHAVNGGKSPHHFKESNELNESLIEEAYRSGALFARKFTAEYPEDLLLKMIQKHAKSH